MLCEIIVEAAMITVEEYLMAKILQALFPERLLTRKFAEKCLVTRLHTIHKLRFLLS